MSLSSLAEFLMPSMLLRSMSWNVTLSLLYAYGMLFRLLFSVQVAEFSQESL